MKREERRSYKQFCGLAKALDVLGERWTLLVVRELLLGPHRYGELLATLPGITTNLLAKRLKEMQASGIIRRTTGPDGREVERYELTEAGRLLEPSIMELARWGGRFMNEPKPGDTRNLGWALLSMKRRYRGGVRSAIAVQSGGRHFELKLTPEALLVEEKVCEQPDVTLAGDQEVFFDLLFRGKDTRSLERSGLLRVDGSRKAYREFLRAFGVSGA